MAYNLDFNVTTLKISNKPKQIYLLSDRITKKTFF